MSEVQQTLESNQVSFQGPCTVERAEELKNSLLSCLNSSRELRMDLSGVTECDLTFIQLVCAVSKLAESQGINIISTSEVSGDIIDLAREIGLYYSCSQCWTQSCVLKEVSEYE